MSEIMKVGQLYPNTAPLGRKPVAADTNQGTLQKPFKDVFKAAQLSFSHHAEVRMKQRGIQLKPEEMGQIANAIEQAAQKGAKDSLVLFHGIAMIVNIPSKTVVTAMDGQALAGSIFTQIDSAVVIP